MSDQVFVVLRSENDRVQTIGPSGQAFASLKEADAFARQLRDRFTHQTFFLCQVTAVYEIQGRATVKKFATPEPTRKKMKTVLQKPDASSPEEASPNIYQMPARIRAAD